MAASTRDLQRRGEWELNALVNLRQADTLEPELSKITRLSSLPDDAITFGRETAEDRPMRLVGSPSSLGKACGLIVRAINGESFEGASDSTAKAATLRFIISNRSIGAIMGKGKVTHAEIEKESAAFINTSREVLPNTNNRELRIEGVGDAVHIAVFYCAKYMLGELPGKRC